MDGNQMGDHVRDDPLLFGDDVGEPLVENDFIYLDTLLTCVPSSVGNHVHV